MARPKKNKFGLFSLFRPFFTIIVLSAFVLGISFLVKTAVSSDSQDVLSVIKPVLDKFNIDPEKLGFVTQTGIVSETKQSSPSQESPNKIKADDIDFSIALLADSHGAYDNLGKALEAAKAERVQYTFFLGDYTDLGVIDDLQSAKKVMDSGGLDYASLPGDHDLWKSVGPQNFIDTFGKNYFSKTINGIKFVGLDNSANYTVIDATQMAWFKKELADADFVLVSQALYHPSNDRVMGIVSGEENASVRFQAKELLKLIRESKVKAIIAGDQHFASQNTDPEKPELKHIVIGALTGERNLQTPRFAYFRALKDGGYVIEDVLLQ